MSDEFVHGIDYSHWQGNNYDYEYLKRHIAFTIPKFTTGTSGVDDTGAAKLAASDQSGLFTGIFHWLTPEEDGTAQAEHILRTVPDNQVDFYALDVEDFERSVSVQSIRDKKARQKVIRSGKVDKYGYFQQVVAGSVIADNFMRCYRRLKEATIKPILLYTRTSFLYDHAPQIIPLIVENNILLWLAQYISTPKVHHDYTYLKYRLGSVKMDWDEYYTKYCPKNYTSVYWKNREVVRKLSYPVLLIPDGVNPELVKIWQWSGDRAHLTGMPGYTELDMFLGNMDEFMSFIGQYPVASAIDKLKAERIEAAHRLAIIDKQLEEACK